MSDTNRHEQLVALARDAGQYGERGSAHLKRQAAGAELRAIEIGAAERSARALERIALCLGHPVLIGTPIDTGSTVQLGEGLKPGDRVIRGERS